MAPQRQIEAARFSADVLSFLHLLAKHGVEYLIVGGEAVIFHGYPRFTEDIDFFFSGTELNAQRLFECLREFWNGNVPEVNAASELIEEGVIVQFGRPPYRIDLLNAIDGVTFAEAWPLRETVQVKGADVPLTALYLDRAMLVRNKRSSGRLKDLDDIEHLE